MLTERLGAAGRCEGELLPGRLGEGGQTAAGGLGAVAGAQPAGCEGRMGPDYAAGAGCEVGRGSGQLAPSEPAMVNAGRAAAVGAGQVPAGCGHGK